MTDEEKVKAKWPDAEHLRDHLFGVSEIHSMIAARGPYSTSIVGVGETCSEAWADATKRLEEN